jgi:hypothetical protein
MTTTNIQKTIRPCAALRMIGVVVASCGRMEIIASSSASQLMLFKKRSRFPEKFRKLLPAKPELPYTTRRATFGCVGAPSSRPSFAAVSAPDAVGAA